MGMNKLKAILTETVIGALIVNAIWYLAAIILRKNVLVNPLDVYASLGQVWQKSMSMHLYASAERIVLGVGIAIILGICIGALMAGNKTANKFLGAFVYFTYPVPKLALLPVVMLLAGIGNTTKIIMIVLIIIFQIIIATRDAIWKIPQEHYHVLTSLGAGRITIWRQVTLPAILPDLLTTIRIAIGTAISVLFVTETYGTDRGMGYFIVDAWMRINYVEMYAGIIILSMTGFFLFLLIDLAEAFACGWKKHSINS